MSHQNAPSAYRVRPGVPADIPRILFLERSIETAPHWNEADYQNCFNLIEEARIKRKLLVAENPETYALLGFAVAKTTELSSSFHPDIEAELESVAVATDAQRLGIGRSLCIVVRDWAKASAAISLHLEVRSGSGAAIALYRSLGFTPYATRPDYYRDPVDDATLMRLILTPPSCGKQASE
jgi:ribosomal-protein-alanine N-acetyltransferase